MSRVGRILGGLAVAGGLFVSAWGVWAHSTHTASDASPGEGDILCPFLAFSPPPTDNLWGFARGAADNGMPPGMALFVTVDVTARQKGWAAVARFEAPDLHRLDEVPDISHDDRYGAFCRRSGRWPARGSPTATSPSRTSSTSSSRWPDWRA